MFGINYKEKYEYVRELGYSSDVARHFRTVPEERIKTLSLGENPGTYNGCYKIIKRKKVSMRNNCSIRFDMKMFNHYEIAKMVWETLNKTENVTYMLAKDGKILDEK